MSSKYPLEQLVLIKKKKLEEAEKQLRARKEALEAEEKKLQTAEKERDKVKEHRFDKLTQLRQQMGAGAASHKIQQTRYYLKEVDQQLTQKEYRVQEQKKQVDAAQKQVDLARADLLKKQQDVEKLRLHREDWDKEMIREELHKEGIETDEMGSAMHTRKKNDKKRPPKS